MPSQQTDRRPRLLLGAILLAALALRLFKLGQANLWWDEALAIWAVRKGLVGVTAWTAGDVHPPLYFWTLWAWVHLFGESAWAMRSLSALLGTLTVWAVHGLGCRIGDRRVGLLAAALTALAPFAIWWSQEMRMYVLAGLLLTVSLRYMLQWLDSEQDEAQPPDTRALILASLASLGALYTIFLSAALLVAQNLLVLMAWLAGGPRRRWGMVWRWAASQIAIALLLSPWLVYSWNRMSTWSVAEPTSPLFVAQLYATLLTTGVSENIQQAMPAMLAVLAVPLLGLIAWLLRRERRGSSGWHIGGLLLAVVVPGVLIYVSTLPRGLFYSPHVEARYFLPFAPAFWALTAWAAVELGRRYRWLGIAAVTLVLGVGSAYLPRYYDGRLLTDDLQSMVRTIISQSREGDLVLLDSGSRYPVFLYDYERLAPEASRPAFATITRAEEPLDEALVQDWMNEHASGDGRIWLAEVDVQLTDPERLVRTALEERLPLVDTWTYEANTLLLYAADETPAHLENQTFTPEHVANLDLGGGQLWGWDLPVDHYTPGSTVHLALFWRTAPQQPVWLQVATEDNYLLLRRHLPEMTEATRLDQDMYLSEGLPTGELTLTLENGSQILPLGQLRIVGERMPAIAAGTSLEITCGGLVLESLSVQADEAEGPGDTVVVDLFWRAAESPATDYTVFVHALGTAYNEKTAGPVWGQHDAPPLDGWWPTSQWQVGDRLVDRHLLTLDEDTPAGAYQLEIGLYDSQTGERAMCYNEDGEQVGTQITLDGFAVR